jgi:hypothetical protein
MKSWYQVRVVAGAAALAIVAGTAQADSIQGPLEVYNSRGQQIGQLIGYAQMAVQINNQWYSVSFIREGLLGQINPPPAPPSVTAKPCG